MSFEFQSTLVNVTPSIRIGGSQIGGVRIEENGGIKVARVIVTNDADVQFALSGPYEAGDPDAIYAALPPTCMSWPLAFLSTKEQSAPSR